MLIPSLDIFKSFIPTIVGENFSKYSAFVSNAELWLKKEISGIELYKKLVAPSAELPEDATELQKAEAAELAEAVKFAQAVVAYKAYADGVPHFDLVETESGFAVVGTGNFAPASQQRVAALQAGMYKKLSEAVETFLEYLEETTSLHDEWKSSPTYTLLSETYIVTLKEFCRHVQYLGNRMEFVTLKPSMLNAIHLKIEPVISAELSEVIIEELRDDELTIPNEDIISDLRFAFANFTLGFNEIGQAYLMRVSKKLYANPDDYPAFRDSDIYQAYVASKSRAPINTADAPLFFAGI
ncbi:MAG: hypothetical protein A2066_12830 [Bacteroidetes bacterium GWB2_41_8]|nr:MAG: hypothetical protein A2066_12830 [Bacteroidetes bacterium GWB2_41_8]